MEWFGEKESIFDFPGFRLLRARPLAQMAAGLLCGGVAILLTVRIISIEVVPRDVLELFLHPGVPIPISIVLATLSLILVTLLVFTLLAVFSSLFYVWISSSLFMLWPWGAYRFRALGLAYFYTWALTMFFHTVLFVLYKTDLGSHMFVVVYTGKGFEFLYDFLLAPGFHLLSLGVAYPISENHCTSSGDHEQAAMHALRINGLDS